MSGGITTDPLLPDAEFRPGGRLPPPLPRSNINNKSSTLLSQGSERLVLVRNPPRERLARAKSSAEPEETLLARVEAKQYPYRHSTTTTTSTRSSNPSIPFPSPSAGSPTIQDEFFADLYQYYYDVTTPPTSNKLPPASSGRVKPKSKSVSSTKSNAPSKKGKHEKDRAQDLEPDDGSDTERDERPDSGLVMAKKRGSLQAIFVPSFLQTSAPSDMSLSPPSSPTSTTSTASTTASKVVQRLLALSAVAQPSPPSAHTTFNDIAPGGTSAVVGENGGISPPLHQRKRSTTFSIMTSFNANANYGSSSSIPSPTTPTGPSHSTIISPRNSPPPAFLQDDDPFANLTSAPSESMVIRSHNTPLHDASSSAQAPLPPVAHPIPRSPLNETVPLLLPSVGSVVLGGASSSGGLIEAVPSSAAIPAPTAPMLPSPLSNAVLPIKNAPIALAPALPSVSVSTSTPQKIKPKSAPSSPPASASPIVSSFSGPHPLLNTHSSHPYHQPPSSPRLVPARPQPRPAHQRPAFSSRPSLPSLNTLARMNVVLTKKVRKGRVGAGLPFEPWDLPSDDESLPTPPPPLSASSAFALSSSSNSARSISTSGHNGPANSNGNVIMNVELNAATPNLNVNVNLNANHDCSSVHPHPITTPSSIVNSIPPASASFSSSPIPIPLSNSASSSSSSSASLASGSGSYLDFDSDSGSSSNSTTPTTVSLISTVSRTRSRPPSPSPLHMNIAKPQPLLPSQILALGSVAADVEMIIPVGNGGPNSMWSKSETVSRSSSQCAQPSSTTSPRIPMVESNPIQEASGSSAPILPAIAPAGPLLIQTSMTMNGQSDFLSESQDAKPDDDVVEEQGRYIEYEERDEYFDVLLDRYQVPSRAGSDDGLEVEEEVEREAEVVAGPAEPPIQQELVTVLEESQWLKGTMEKADEDVQPLPEHAPAVTVPESTRTQETRDENITTSEHPSIHAGSGDVDVDVEAGTSPGLTRSDSLFSSPPSSASLSRSFSMTSGSSIGSAESGSGVEHTGRRPEDMRSYRRFGGDPSQSLSSLELDIDAHREDQSEGGLFEAVDVPSISRERAGTRSSSDDGDAVELTTPGDDERGYFPYSHAGTFARFFQSGYSTLFSPPVPYKEDGPSYLPETGHFNLSSSSSSVDDLGGEREAEMWGKAFVEEGMDMPMPGGFAAELNHRNESDLGIGKVLIAAEECQRDDVEKEKEKESLANTTSIAPVRTTSTITTEADRLSHPSSDHSQPVPSSSSSSPPVDQETSPLHSESVTQAIDSPGALIDDEMVTRHRMGPSNDAPPRPRATAINPRTSSSTTEPMDSSGYQRHGSSNSQQYRTRASHEQTTNYNTSGSTSISAAFRDGRRGERKRNSDDEEEERRRRRAVERMRWDDGVAKFAGSTSSSEEDDYGEAASKSRLAPWKTTTAGTRSPPPADSFMTASSRSPSIKRMDFPSSSNHSSQYVTEDEREEEDDEEDDDDDDVPLAQRIPGALTAQKTMRRKFREEREQRKREKAERGQHADAERRARQETLRPAGAGVVLHDGVGAVPSSSSQDAALFAAYAVHPQTRQRTLTLPGKSPVSPPSALNPHDLARKLQNVQMTEVSSLAHQQQYQYPQQYHDPHAALSPTHVRAKSISRTSAEHQQSRSPSHPVAPPLPPLTTVRSRSIKDPSPSYQIPPGTSPLSPSPHGPPAGTLRPMRSFHRPSERRPIGMEEPVPALPSPHTDIDHRLARSSTSVSRSPHHRSPSLSRTSADRPERVMEPVPPLPAPFKVLQGNDESKKLVKPNPAQEARSPSTRVSGDADRSPRMGIAQQPMPGLVNVNKVVTSQQRVFVGNLQQFHMVEIGPSTTAGDVVAMMEAEGALKGWAGIGGWMVYEIAQDFGMERPVRSYELLADVQASWLKDKSVNFFVLKLTPLAVPLSRNAIPASSPTHSGYIEWEAKRGKWSKRWLQLREHNLYLAKRDNGKDEVLICSLSNFDAYQITRNHRAPKPFAFAIKSTDNLSFFENTADYMHTFSCNEKDGKIWLEKILVARSYVLHQERHILFKPAGNNASPAVSRSGTKKYAPVRPNHQPLVALPPNGVFEPGSLLGKHI